MSTKDIISGVVMVIYLVVSLGIIGYFWKSEIRGSRQDPSKKKVQLVTERDLPPILTELIEAYMEAKQNGESFSFGWTMERGGVLLSIARCPSCGQKNRLGGKSVDGARCGSCGLPLERYPKAKRSDRTTN